MLQCNNYLDYQKISYRVDGTQSKMLKNKYIETQLVMIDYGLENDNNIIFHLDFFRITAKSAWMRWTSIFQSGVSCALNNEQSDAEW